MIKYQRTWLPLNMSCGQTSLYPRCLEAMGTQVEHPIYYPSYLKTEVETIGLLRRLFNTQNDVLLLECSATFGEEAALFSALEPGDRVLVVNSGTFGQVLADLVRVPGAEPIEIIIERGRAVDPERIRRTLLEDGSIKMVAMVHVETTTGGINHIDRVGAVLKDFPEVLFTVDAVSSLGAMEVRVDDWGIDFCCSSAQKCVNGPQGITPVTVSEKGWKAIRNRRTPIRSLCLDLTEWKNYHDAVRKAYESGLSGERRLHDLSMATERATHGPSPSYVLVKGLKASLEEIFEEGPENVFRRHRIASKAVRSAVRAMGLKVLAAEEDAASSCTTVIWPEGLDTGELNRRMYDEHGVTLGGHRIGTMGFVASPKFVIPAIAALEKTMCSMGYDGEIGVGVRAANEVFAAGE